MAGDCSSGAGTVVQQSQTLLISKTPGKYEVPSLSKHTNNRWSDDASLCRSKHPAGPRDRIVWYTSSLPSLLGYPALPKGFVEIAFRARHCLRHVKLAAAQVHALDVSGGFVSCV